MACNLVYIEKSNYSSSIKRRLTSEHNNIFKRLKESGYFNITSSSLGESLLFAKPSNVTSVRKVQDEIVKQVNTEYKENIIKAVKSGNNEVVSVNVLPLASFFSGRTSSFNKLIFNNLPIEDTAEGIIEGDQLEGEEGNTTRFSTDTNKDAVVHLLDKLKQRTGIDYLTINDGSIPWKGKFSVKQGKALIEINLYHANEKTAIHEYMHPFLIAFKNENPIAYSKLVDELYSNHSSVLDQIKKEGNYDSKFLVDEALVRVLTDLASSNEKSSLVQRFFDWLADFISFLTGVKSEKIKSANLKKLAQEFTYADDLYNRLDSVRQLDHLEDMFEISNDDFRNVIHSEKFKKFANNTDNKIKLIKSITKDKSNIFGKKFTSRINQLNDVFANYNSKISDYIALKNEENPNAEKIELAKDQIFKSVVTLIDASKRQVDDISERFIKQGGIFDTIEQSIEGNNIKLIHRHLSDLEAARNYFHIFNDFNDLQQVADELSEGDKDDYNRSPILKILRDIKVDINRKGLNKSNDDIISRAFQHFQRMTDEINNDKPVSTQMMANIGSQIAVLNSHLSKDFLTEYNNVLKDNKINKSIIEAIKSVTINIDRIKKQFNDKYVNLITEVLYKAVPDNAVIIKNGEKIKVDKDILRYQLKIADEDTGVLDTWFSAAISSRDAVTAITARYLKDIMQGVEDELLEDHYNLRKLYSEANPDNIDATKFHSKYITDMKVLVRDSEGNLIEAKDDDEFIFNPFDGKKYKIEVRKRYITKLKEDIKDIDTKFFWRELSKEGFISVGELNRVDPTRKIEWLISRGNSEEKAKRILSIIETNEKLASSHIDNQYNEHQNDPYYQKLLSLYKKGNDRLGIEKQLKHHEIPQVKKEGSFGTSLKQSWNSFMRDVVRAEGDEYKDLPWYKRFLQWLFHSLEVTDFTTEDGKTLRRQYLDGAEVYSVKTRFTRRLPVEELEYDLFSTTLAFTHAASITNKFTEVEPTINALKTILIGDPEMDIIARDAVITEDGAQAFNAKVNQYLTKKTGINSTKRLVEFINDVVYDVEDVEKFNINLPIGGKKYSINKLASKALGFASLQNIAFNWIGGVSNYLTGNANNISLAIAGEYMTFSDFRKAKTEYWGNIGDILQDYSINDINKKSLYGQLAIKFDAIQGEFKGFDGSSLNQTTMQKLMSTNTLFVNQGGGEHEIQITGMLGLMRGFKVNGIPLRDLVSLDENGKLKFDESVKKEDLDSFRNKLHALSKQLHGNYNKFDKTMLQRRWYGKLFIAFRKYLYTSYRARFGSEKYDYELEAVTKGYYREAGSAFWNHLAGDIFNWSELAKNYNNMNETQRAAIRRTAFEVGLMLSMWMIAMAIAGIELDDDDEVLAWLLGSSRLQALRLSKDFQLYNNPFTAYESLYKTISTPSVVVPTIDKLAKVAFYMLPNHWGDTYERKTGIAEAGDSKLGIAVLKAAPIFRQLSNLLDPDEQLRFYDMLAKNSF